MTARELPPNLTGRQLEVLALTCRGAGAREVGLELGIAETTVRKHLIVLRQKFDVSRKRELIEEGIRFGALEGNVQAIDKK